jgi:Fur family ferric uptake transcriptional regulator
MENIHKLEKEQFKRLLTKENIKDIDDRFNVLEAFLQTEHHITAQDFIDFVNKKGYSFEPDFIKACLKFMCSMGFAKENRFKDRITTYEHKHLDAHHDHIICVKCGKIAEFNNEEIENIQLEIAKKNGFHMLQHKMDIYGICFDCLGKRETLIPLAFAKTGEKLIVKQFISGRRMQARLTSMGVRIGDKIEIITKQDAGQMVIALDYNRMIIGANMAKKILVEPVI